MAHGRVFCWKPARSWGDGRKDVIMSAVLALDPASAGSCQYHEDGIILGADALLAGEDYIQIELALTAQ